MIGNQEQKPKFEKPKRDKTISIKVTNNELSKIYLYASEKPHTSISEYVRDKALKQAKRPVEITEEDYRKLERFIMQHKENKKIVETNKNNNNLSDDYIVITKKELQAIGNLINLYSNSGTLDFTSFNKNKEYFLNVKRAFDDLIKNYKNS